MKANKTDSFKEVNYAACFSPKTRNVDLGILVENRLHSAETINGVQKPLITLNNKDLVILAGHSSPGLTRKSNKPSSTKPLSTTNNETDTAFKNLKDQLDKKQVQNIQKVFY